MTRTEFLREVTITSQNKVARTAMPTNWEIHKRDESVVERRAYAVRKILEEMPLYIGEQELVVGTRTFLRPLEGNADGKDVSAYDIHTLPQYINEDDVNFFGFNHQSLETHSAAGYDIILKLGVQGIVEQAKASLEKQTVSEKQEFLKAVISAYEGLGNLIERYAYYAEEQSKQERDHIRAQELLDIAANCHHIKQYGATNFAQACQLLWFAHIAVMIENMSFMNYGRLDQVLYPYLGDMDEATAQQYVDCLLLKMYDDADLKISYLGAYSAQLNVTIGGVTPEGEDGVNPVTYMLIEAKKRTRLPDPQYAIRVHSKNPKRYVREVCGLAAEGINCVAYYNDDLWIESMIGVGVKAEYANDYSFDLCQDITVAGKGDFCTSGSIGVAHELMAYLKQTDNTWTWEMLYEGFKKYIADKIEQAITQYNDTLIAYMEFNEGNHAYYLDRVKEGKMRPALGWGKSLMAPTPLTSGLFEGCVESATDLTRMGCVCKDKGFYLQLPVQTINSLAAIKWVVFDNNMATLEEVMKACEDNYSSMEQEVLRQRLFNAPKWGNDDDRVDWIAKDFFEFACKEVTKYATPDGGRHLAGIHQAHPVGTGHGLMATPDGRKAGEPVPVTLTPTNGTIKNGATAALKSATKIDYKVYQWNFCIMLQYYASVFGGEEGAERFENLLMRYFEMGGTQHQPNVLDAQVLKYAQENPEDYKDVVVRLWGVSAHFVDLPKELQEEIIARYEE